MIEFKSTKENFSDLERLDRLNRAAFPKNERLEMDKQLGLQRDGEFDVQAIYYNGEFAGFITFRPHEKLAYICYFSIEESLRSKGIGGEVLRRVHELYRGKQAVVEMELPDKSAPDYELRLRRKNFYLRSGFYETGWGVEYFGAAFEICAGVEDFDVSIFKDLMLSIDAPGFHPRFFKIK